MPHFQRFDNTLRYLGLPKMKDLGNDESFAWGWIVPIVVTRSLSG
jgi:hypothetical protein